MIKKMKNRVSIQLSLRLPDEKFPVLSDKTNNLLKIFGIFPKKLWNDYFITGDKSGVYGNAIGVTGDVSGIKGPLTGIRGDVQQDIIPFLMERQQMLDD